MEERFLSQPPDAGSRFAEPRLALRFAFIASLEIIEPITKMHASGRVTEISQKGCFAEVTNPLPVKSFVQLRIRRDEGLFETWARVIYDRPRGGMGFLFIHTTADQSKVLKTWLDELKAK